MTVPHLASASFVEFNNVQFAYQDRKIINGVSLKVKKGSVVALMGGSGCGKTTLLRLLGAQVRAQSGTVSFDGDDMAKVQGDSLFKARRKMGMLFQFGALFTDLSVFDNVAFPLREHTKLNDAMIRDLVLMKLNAVGLRGAAQLMPSQISGGMARRVALARAIALDPQLLLFDEPFAGLDPISLGTIANLIRTLNDALGSTSIVVSHDVQETFQIADYIYVMGSGKILAEGTPDSLTKSEVAEVRQFLDGERDGPVPFHYPAKPISDDLNFGSNVTKVTNPTTATNASSATKGH
jgi:phospholipid/cholesterol/gamma-HCH transport system ATP-binding protein